jgi:hypothetical protein
VADVSSIHLGLIINLLTKLASSKKFALDIDQHDGENDAYQRGKKFTAIGDQRLMAMVHIQKCRLPRARG